MPRSKPPRRKKIIDPARPMLQRLAKERLLIPAGIHAYERMLGSMDEATAEAFMAGCAFTFAVMVRMNDDGPPDDPDMPTEADMDRMERLASEIDQIDHRLRIKYGKPLGSA